MRAHEQCSDRRGVSTHLPVRTLERDQLQWRVYEVSTLAVPGAPVPRCLIFDSDAVVRRCWTYPDNWAGLDDQALWSLLAVTAARRTTTLPSTPLPAPESQQHRDPSQALHDERDELLRSCRESHDALLAAVGRYAIGLKNSGLTPELALVLVKEAIRDGLGGAAQAEEPDGVALMGDGVAHAIKAYYAV